MHSKRLAASVLLLAVTACSGGSDDAKPTPSPTTASPTPSPTPAPVDFLTGSTTIGKGPLVAVKIDNAPLAQQYHRGLDRAALVYEELVEGGTTRLLAVYESDVAGAGEVGPIRSIRESDIELTRMFGDIAVAYSGGNTGVKAIVRDAAKRGFITDASYDAIPSAYRLGTSRKDARNFFTVPATIAKLKPAGKPRDIGLRFGPVNLGGVPVATATATYSPRFRVQVKYVAATGTWQVIQNGRLMQSVSADNIVLQRVVERPSRFRDVNGFPTPYTKTLGTGQVTVLREGRRFTGTWKRDGYGPTRFRDAKGADIKLKPGSTWVLLVPSNGGSVSFG